MQRIEEDGAIEKTWGEFFFFDITNNHIMSYILIHLMYVHVDCLHDILVLSVQFK